MKRLFVCAHLFVLAMPLLVRADDPCGCGKTSPTQSGETVSSFPITCPLYPVDQFTWYAEYFETSCWDAPSATWLPDPQIASDCNPLTCESDLRRLQQARSSYGSYSGRVVGHDFVPKVMDPQHVELVDHRFVSFRFHNPITNQPEEVVAKVFQYRVTLKDQAEEPRWRFVAYEVKDAGPHPCPPISSLGLQARVDHDTRTIRLVHDDPQGQKITVLVRLASEH